MHCINTALRHTLNETFLIDEVPSVFSFNSKRTKNCELGLYMKRSGLVSRLPRTLHADIETRWNSIYMLLNSFHSQYQEVWNIMHEKGKHEIISAYDRNLMGELIQFLESFKEATDNLEGDKEPTLPLAVP